MHNGVTSHLWLKSALHASSHPCMCTCVLRLGCFLLACPVLYFVPPFSFQPFLMFTSEFNERSRSNPLCDFRLGTVVTSDHETPLTSPVRPCVFTSGRLLFGIFGDARRHHHHPQHTPKPAQIKSAQPRNISTHLKPHQSRAGVLCSR